MVIDNKLKRDLNTTLSLGYLNKNLLQNTRSSQKLIETGIMSEVSKVVTNKLNFTKMITDKKHLKHELNLAEIDKTDANSIISFWEETTNKLPILFSASYIWFLFNNINFNKLYWSFDEHPEEDEIIFDGKCMWKFWPDRKTLFLLCSWNDSLKREMEKVMSKTQHSKTLYEHLDKPILKPFKPIFVESLKGYINATLQKETINGSNFNLYQKLLRHVISKIETKTSSNYNILSYIKEYFTNLDYDSKQKLTKFMLYDFEGNDGDTFCSHIRELNIFKEHETLAAAMDMFIDDRKGKTFYYSTKDQR